MLSLFSRLFYDLAPRSEYNHTIDQRLQSSLFQLAGPLTFAEVAILSFATAMLACLIPARRATKSSAIGERFQRFAIISNWGSQGCRKLQPWARISERLRRSFQSNCIITYRGGVADSSTCNGCERPEFQKLCERARGYAIGRFEAFEETVNANQMNDQARP